MIYIQALWDLLYHPVHAALKNEQELARMKGSGSDTVKALASVADDVLNGTVTVGEAQWRDRIESLRTRMERSNEILSIADYGAQSPLKQLSAQTMYAGRVVTRSVREVCRSSSKPLKWSMFLFRLVRRLKPESLLELGTCLGISGAYIGAAMSMNGFGSLVTIEGAETLAAKAQTNFDTLGFRNIETVVGRFQDRLDAVLQKTGRLDAVLIDGHHDGAATLRYFETILPALAPGAVVVFDDIGWSMEMHEAWKMLRAHHSVGCSIDMFDMGICCIGGSVRETYRIAI